MPSFDEPDWRKASCVHSPPYFMNHGSISDRTNTKTNCVSELLPQQALARADELDAYMTKYKKVTGPLHGLPISVKECIGMKGLTCHGGFAAWADKEAPDDALILKILLKAGCVLYARTNEPQTLVCFHSLFVSRPWQRELAVDSKCFENMTRKILGRH